MKDLLAFLVRSARSSGSFCFCRTFMENAKYQTSTIRFLMILNGLVLHQQVLVGSETLFVFISLSLHPI